MTIHFNILNSHFLSVLHSGLGSFFSDSVVSISPFLSFFFFFNMSNKAEDGKYIHGWVAFFFSLIVKKLYQIYYYIYYCTKHWLPLYPVLFPFNVTWNDKLPLCCSRQYQEGVTPWWLTGRKSCLNPMPIISCETS